MAGWEATAQVPGFFQTPQSQSLHSPCGHFPPNGEWLMPVTTQYKYLSIALLFPDCALKHQPNNMHLTTLNKG